MLRRIYPVADDPVELLVCCTCMRDHHYFSNAFLTRCECLFHIACKYGFVRFFGLPFGMLWCKHLHAIYCKKELEVHGLFGPERTIVVEYCNTVFSFDKARAALCSGIFYKFHNGPFNLAVVP